MKNENMIAYAKTPPSAWIQVTGNDAPNFLQGQFSNDLEKGFNKFINNWYSYGLWLDHKGKILADSTIVKGINSTEFWIHSSYCKADDICTRLEGFIIADDVVLDNQTNAWSAITLIGQKSRKLLENSNLDGIYAFNGRRGSEESFELIYLRSAEAQIQEIIKNCDSMSLEDLEHLRIKAGVVRIPQDAGSTDLPQEVALQKDAVSVTKGCYVGQEVMARLANRGRIRRKLVQVRGTGQLPNIPCAVWDSENKVGELRSAVVSDGGFIGLALMSVSSVEATSAFSLTANANRDLLVS
jgi:folate-binding protein YgfZ